MKRIIVGFSGGIDSVASVEILREKGFDPIAVFLKISRNQDLNEVKNLAEKLKIDLIVKDISNIFKDCIIKSFLDDYQNNKTPNPCVKCNREIKFRFLLEIADKMGIKKVATGHYARIKERNKKFRLLKGKDLKKDQSYFLYRLIQKELSRIIFPLGDKTKQDIKKMVLGSGFFKKIKESQDICFLENEKKVRDYLKDNLKSEPGEIRNERNEFLGRHQGLACYTQGQRKSLNLAGGPFYVIGKNLQKNILVVSKNKKHSNLMNEEIYLKQTSWTAGVPDLNLKYDFKSRYRTGLISGKLKKEGKIWKVLSDKPQWAVAVGQSLVVYLKEEVVGGGIINKVK